MQLNITAVLRTLANFCYAWGYSHRLSFEDPIYFLLTMQTQQVWPLFRHLQVYSLYGNSDEPSVTKFLHPTLWLHLFRSFCKTWQSIPFTHAVSLEMDKF